MQTDNRQLDEVNEAIEDERLELNSWESDFIENINDYVNTGGILSRKQREALDRIHEKIRSW